MLKQLTVSYHDFIISGENTPSSRNEQGGDEFAFGQPVRVLSGESSNHLILPLAWIIFLCIIKLNGAFV